jgi:epoxyqueuosine reductase
VTPGEEVKAVAASLGFIACGITDLSATPHGPELDEWLERGYAGTMRYLHRQAALRREPAAIVPGARSAIIVLDSYFHPDTSSDLAPPKIAKYARGTDYHIATMARIEELADYLRSCGARIARPFVDAGPVPERELAQRAGLGWIGKNTMLIRPGVGSFFFLGAVLTDLEFQPDTPLEADHCGSCTACLEACPTEALVEPRVLDTTRCISYLTIESRGSIPSELESKLQGWAFGCDICNDVCPWNQRFAEPSSSTAEFKRREEPAKRPDYFETMSDGDFDATFGDTPFERPGLDGMRRNWKAALASVGRL